MCTRTRWRDRARGLTDTPFAETTVQTHQHETDAVPQGSAPMELLPQTTLGNFFNQQRRLTSMLQMIESVSVSHNGPAARICSNSASTCCTTSDGASVSRPVLIERADGTLARRLDFSGPTTQSIDSTDLALFVQDRFQPNTRWSVEFGGRLDRDGVIDRFNVTPRIGAAVRLNESGSAVRTAGLGSLRCTPSTAALWPVRDLPRFALRPRRRHADRANGPVRPRHENLETPRTRTWTHEHRRTGQWLFHLGGIAGRSHELIVEPLRPGAGVASCNSSSGRSSHRAADVAVHHPRHDGGLPRVAARSSAQSDLNALTNYSTRCCGPWATTPTRPPTPTRRIAFWHVAA
jgi:hypothetical protein